MEESHNRDLTNEHNNRFQASLISASNFEDTHLLTTREEQPQTISQETNSSPHQTTLEEISKRTSSQCTELNLSFKILLYLIQAFRDFFHITYRIGESLGHSDVPSSSGTIGVVYL